MFWVKGSVLGKGVRSQLCEAPVGPFRQLTPDPFTPTPRLNVDGALVFRRASIFAISVAKVVKTFGQFRGGEALE